MTPKRSVLRDKLGRDKETTMSMCKCGWSILASNHKRSLASPTYLEPEELKRCHGQPRGVRQGVWEQARSF
jgi:hypothetical protein